MTGANKLTAAKKAGYVSPGAEYSPAVRYEIAQARAKLTDITMIRRIDVIDGILDGVSIARMQADAANVIKGWCEIGKILGHYAPEQHNINLTLDQQRLRSKFEALSDEELLSLQNNPQLITDATTVTEAEA